MVSKRKKKSNKGSRKIKQKGGDLTTAYVINLKDRTDRKEIISNKFKDSSIVLEFLEVERHPAGAHVGTGDSFMKIIQKALDLKLNSVLMFEDDNMPLDNFDSRWNTTKQWLDTNMDKWEIFNGGARIYDSPNITLKHKLTEDISLFEMSQFLGLNWIYLNSSVFKKALEWTIDKDGPIDRYLGNNSIFKNLCIYPYLGLQEVGISNSWGKHINLTSNDKRMKNIFQTILNQQQGGNNTVYIKRTPTAEAEALYPIFKNMYPNKKIEFVEDRDTYDLIVVHCLGGAPQNQPYILICGEEFHAVQAGNLNDPNCIGYFLSTQHPDAKKLKNYYYFPLCLTIGYELYDKSPFVRKYNDIEKPNLCAFVARSATTQREQMFNALKALDDTYTVDALGAGLHTKDVTLPQYWWDLPDVYKDYKFVLTIENSDKEEGYITEKIMNAYRASAIPIYWGTTKVKEIFNPASFIFLKDYTKADGSIDYDACAKEVIAISKDDERYKKMQNEPIFNKNMNPDLSTYYDTPSPQWVVNIANELKIRLNIQNGGASLKDITIGILTWKSCSTLVNTLKSYKENGLLDMINTFVYIQEMTDIEKQIADKYNVTYIGSESNIGIQKALIKMIEHTKTPYFIFAENDFELIHNADETAKVLEDCIKLLDDDVQIVKLRDKVNPGEPNYSQYTYQNDFKDKPNVQDFPYKLEALSYIETPEDVFPNAYKIVEYNYKWYKSSNKDNKWSNNIFMAKTDWMKKNILPLIDTSRNNTKNIYIFENGLIENLKDYNLAAGIGLFKHNRLDRSGCTIENVKGGTRRHRKPKSKKTRKHTTRSHKKMNKKSYTIQQGGGQVHYITVSTEDNNKLQRLVKSAEKNNIKIDVLGLELKTNNLGHSNNAKFGMKLGLPQKYISNLPDDDIVVFTDAWDVIYNNNADQLVTRYKSFNKPIVFGAELYCWPDDHMASSYDTQNNYFKYLNSGLYIGRVGDLKRMLSTYTGGEDIDDQRFWTEKYLKNRDIIALDLSANMFLNAAGTDKSDFMFDGSIFTFKKTNTNPCIIHANSADKTYLDLFTGQQGGNSKEITWFLPVYVPFVNAGAEMVAHAINKYFIKKGYTINVVGHWDAQVIESINYISEWSGDDVNAAINRSVALFAQQNSTFATLSKGKEHNKNVFIIVHNTERQFYDPDKFKTLIDPSKIFLVFNSEWVKNDYKTDLNNMVVHPPVNCDDYSTISNNKYVTLINVSELKGGNQFIEIAKKMPDLQFLGVEGGYDTQIKGDVPNITYVPNTRDMKSIYGETQILLMPSRAETWGRTATEALCSGIPVIANPTMGLKENLGDAGLFINRDSIDEWVAMIRKLKDHSDYYNSVSAKCKERSAILSSEDQLDELLSRLEKLPQNVQSGGDTTTAYVINLDTSVTRWNTIQNDFKGSSIMLERFNAIRDPLQNAGLGKSFVEVVKNAKQKNLPSVLIFEDDNKPLENFDKRWQVTKAWLESNKDKWDIFTGGPRFTDWGLYNATTTTSPFIESLELIVSLDENVNIFKSLTELFSTNWIYINSNVYDTIINYTIEKNGPIDRFLCNINNFKLYLCIPILGLQHQPTDEDTSPNRHFNFSEIDKGIIQVFNTALMKAKQKGGKNKTRKLKKKQKGGNKIINLSNGGRLGDCMFTVVYLNTIRKYLEENNITVHYYVGDEYKEQIDDFVQPTNKNVLVQNLSSVPSDAIDTWVGQKPLYEQYVAGKSREEAMPLDTFFPIFFSDIGTKVGLPKLTKFMYEDASLLDRYNNLEDKYKDTDLLIINSSSISGDYPERNSKSQEWDDFVRLLSKKYKIVTTVKVDDITCTKDANFKIKDIAAISTHAKNIITIHTGPMVGLFNIYTFDSVKKWFMYSNHHTYTIPNFYYNTPFDEVIKMLEN